MLVGVAQKEHHSFQSSQAQSCWTKVANVDSDRLGIQWLSTDLSVTQKKKICECIYIVSLFIMQPFTCFLTPQSRLKQPILEHRVEQKRPLLQCKTRLNVPTLNKVIKAVCVYYVHSQMVWLDCTSCRETVL